ncbi:3'-5' exonuclease [Candidatus Saccharibacteria bacterium]|nr:3'-5' exonuclease [Candidatus Saccharibacteria bacterium]
MKGFAKDILLMDFESTGIDPVVHEPTQLGAILLDKETLQEKDSYLTFIGADLSKASKEALEISGISQKDLEDAPAQEEVAKEFLQKFGTDVFLSSWNSILDRGLLDKMLRIIGKTIFEYDYHYLDVWPICYMYLCRTGQGDKLRGDATFKALGLPQRQNHDALEDCRYAAEALKAVYEGKEY